MHYFGAFSKYYSLNKIDSEHTNTYKYTEFN